MSVDRNQYPCLTYGFLQHHIYFQGFTVFMSCFCRYAYNKKFKLDPGWHLILFIVKLVNLCCTGMFKSARNHFVIQIFSKDYDELKQLRDDERQCSRTAKWSGAVRTYRSWEPSPYDKQQCTPHSLTWSMLVVFFQRWLRWLIIC